MQILNLACNGHRPPPPFINVDVLRSQLKPGTPERRNLDAELNYLDHDLRRGVPFAADTIDGILCSHFIEHLDAIESVAFLQECRRVLRPGHPILVSVPDASYFREVHARDTPENALALFGEGIYDWEVAGKRVGPFHSFFDYALFHHEHKQVLTADSLWCLLVKAGFPPADVSMPPAGGRLSADAECVFNLMAGELNRPKFSLVLWAKK